MHDKTLGNEYRKNNIVRDKKTTVPDDEERGFGRVSMKVYKDYLLYGAWPSLTFIVVLVFFTGQGRIVKTSPKYGHSYNPGQNIDDTRSYLVVYSLL